MVDSDSGKSKKEKQVCNIVGSFLHLSIFAASPRRSRVRVFNDGSPASGFFCSFGEKSTLLFRVTSSMTMQSSRVDPRQVIGTPGSIERFAVPVQNSSTSSHEVTPRRDDNSSLESHRHDRVPSRSFSSSSVLPPVTGSTSQSGLGLSIPPQPVAPRDSPVITKSSPGKRSLQEKVNSYIMYEVPLYLTPMQVNYEYGVLTTETTPPAQTPNQVFPSTSAQPTLRSSPPKRDAGSHNNSPENKTRNSDRDTPVCGKLWEQQQDLTFIRAIHHLHSICLRIFTRFEAHLHLCK